MFYIFENNKLFFVKNDSFVRLCLVEMNLIWLVFCLNLIAFYYYYLIHSWKSVLIYGCEFSHTLSCSSIGSNQLIRHSNIFFFDNENKNLFEMIDRIIRCSSQRLVDLLNDERKKFLLFARFAQHDTLLDARFWISPIFDLNSITSINCYIHSI